MSDIIDRACELEQLHRDMALKRQTQTYEQPEVYKGVRVCLACEQPIPKQRLKALPRAVRCTDCQLMVELKQKNYRKL